MTIHEAADLIPLEWVEDASGVLYVRVFTTKSRTSQNAALGHVAGCWLSDEEKATRTLSDTSKTGLIIELANTLKTNKDYPCDSTGKVVEEIIPFLESLIIKSKLQNTHI